MMTGHAAVVASICAEFGLRIIPKSRYPEAGETRAAKTLERILAKHGEGHLRLVLTTLLETEGNRGNLDEAILWATSDLVRACSGIVEKRTSHWLEFWDTCPTAELQWSAQRLSGHVSQRAAIAGMIFERILYAFGDEAFG